MKNLMLLLLIIGIAMTAQAQSMSENPFYKEYSAPFQAPPFDQIKIEHYMPAFEKGLKEAAADVKNITSNKEAPNFKNTVEALEVSGALLTKVSNVFFNVLSANSSPEMQQIAQDISPKLSKNSDDMMLNQKLFERIKKVQDNIGKEKLSPEQIRLAKKYYDDFIRSGANLKNKDKDRMREINLELSSLSLKFGDNMLAETNNFKLYIDNENDLSGLPKSLIDGAREAAAADGNPDKWLFTLHNPSIMPFLQYADNRELRRTMLDGYLNRCNHNDEFDNKEIAARLVALRDEKAKLLGFANHAEYTLEPNMAKNSKTVMELLNKLWDAALPNARREADLLQELVDQNNGGFKLEACDWRYYTEKLRQKQFDIDEEALKAYFPLDAVVQGAFYVAEQLYGLKFKELSNIPVYQEDVKVYEVMEADGTHIGVFYTDFYTRSNKKGGAWMNGLRDMRNIDGKLITPLVTNVCNFSKPTAEMPSLLTFDEVETVFHEFGHALHGLLAKNTYSSIGGTAVPRDFVELPSQVMENWASQRDVLKMFAKHYQTGETIPDDMLDKLEQSSKFNQGFATVEYLAAAILDMRYYTDENAGNINVAEFERRVAEEIGLIPEIPFRYRSTYFAHIFSGGYSSGYYSYIWSGVLDSDAFNAFEETSLFDKKTAESFRRNVLERGYTDEPMNLYKKFRGREPRIEPLLKKRGLI